MNPLTIADTRIRQYANGLCCLNDLYKAAVAQGANARTKEPGKFLASTRTQELIKLLEAEVPAQNLGAPITQNWGNAPGSETTPNLRSFQPQQTTQILGSLQAPIVTIEGRDGGTYVCIELVIAYGQFVSAAFDLKVIRTFLAVQHQEHAMPHIQSTKFWDLLRPHWRAIADLALVGCKNKEIAETLGRSAGSVGRNLRRMYEVGYLNPVAVFTARLKPATAARWATEKPVAMHWGRPLAPAAQGVLDFGQAAAAAQGGAQ